MSRIDLPTLFKKTSTGALQSWKICVEGSTIITAWGQVGSLWQIATDVVSAGKNAGRSNATTPEEQARAEAQSRWEKQKKNKGYVETQAAALAGAVDPLVAGGIAVMLAHRYDEHSHKITWPALVQPKLDGHRCVAVVEDGTCTLWSRTRKPITGVPHIVRAVEHWADRIGRPNVVLDGELYNHTYHGRFEELSSFIRSATPKAGHEVVQYHVYDLVLDLPQQARSEMLGAFSLGTSLVRVETKYAADEAEMMDLFARFLDEGYEGAIVRNLNAAYIGRRSYDLQKVKTMADDEYKIVDVKEGRGKMAGKAIFTCCVPSGQRFDVKMIGALSTLEAHWKNAAGLIGRRLTVKYQNLTADGLPRFPVGLRIRDE